MKDADFDLVTARLVLALARDGSIGRAGESENITPSAISRRLSELEQRLSVVLFDRTAQGVVLTEAGRTYLIHARALMAGIADLEMAMGAFASGVRGRLRLASTSASLSGRLPELLARFAKDRPGIVLEIAELTAARALAALAEGRVDIAIVSDNYDFSGLLTEPFEDDRVWVIAPPDHALGPRLDGRSAVPFAAVIVHEAVGIHQAGALDRLIDAEATRLGHKRSERVRVETFPALVRLVEAGFGIGFLRATSLHLLAGTDLVAAPIAEDWAHRRLRLVRRDRAPESAAVIAFLALAREG